MSQLFHLLTEQKGQRIDLVDFLSARRAEDTIAHQASQDFARAVVAAEKEGYMLTTGGKCLIGETSMVWCEDYSLDSDEGDLVRACEELGIDLSGVRSDREDSEALDVAIALDEG
jgi:hypothetical protein